MQYQLYMYLRVVNEFRLPMACCDIGIIWHSHILFTAQYQEFCIRANGGKIIHHTPTQHHRARVNAQTCKLWKHCIKSISEIKAFGGGEVTIC